jgi:hypothetical protein
MIDVCSCGFGTDDREWHDGHLFNHPGHHEGDIGDDRAAEHDP